MHLVGFKFSNNLDPKFHIDFVRYKAFKALGVIIMHLAKVFLKQRLSLKILFVLLSDLFLTMIV